MATPGKRVYLHIGAPKTGTTYLQALMGHNRAILKSHGVLYPKTKSNAHHMATWDLRGVPEQRRDVAGIEGTWTALVDRCNAWEGQTVVLSSELLVFCDDDQIARALAAFEAEVHVIYTARDLVRQVPAAWQEEVKNQGTTTFGDFIDRVLRSRRRGRRHAFWNAQDVVQVLARWTPERDPSRVHLVTAPAPGAARSLLWERFVSVFLADSDALDTDTSTSDNVSLSMLQTELLRRYNQRHGAAMSWPQYRRTVRSQLEPFLIKGIEDSRRLVLRQREWRSLRREADRMVGALSGAGYDVTGDLAELLPPQMGEGRGSRQIVAPEDLADEELLAAALDTVHQLLSVRAAPVGRQSGSASAEALAQR